MKSQLTASIRLGAVCLFFLVLSLGSRPVAAQVSGGLAGISGVVRDPTGAVVPGAQVVVSNPSKGVRLTLNTTEGGVFNAPSLLPATGYDVTVDKQGFAQYEVKDIALAVGQNLSLEVPLTVAGATEKMEVVGTAPIVDTTKSDVSSVIDSEQIVNLPLNGRRVDSFVLLTPGVTNDGNYGLLTFRGVANGNTFLLDGNDSTEQFFVENNGRTRITSQISLDAVQEFQVVSTNYSAEYGRAMGGVVNTVTRSGTNDLHGTAFFFYRNQDMMARDPYTPVSFGNPDQWRLQSGASIGGPIIKDKLFFFINGDFTRNNFPFADTYSGNTTYLTQTATGATFGTTGTPCAATVAQCNAINALLPAFYGLIPRSVDQDLAFGRLDYHYSDRNIFSISFNFMHFKSPNGLQQTVATSTTGQGVNSNGDDYGRVRNGKVTWTSILNSNAVNTFRYGLNTDLEGDNPSSSLTNALGLLDVCVGSTGSCSSGVHLGPVNYLPRIEPDETRNEFADDFSWTRGRHIFKFGVDIATTNDFSIYLPNLYGQYNFATVTAFAEDFSGNTAGNKDWSSYTQSFGNSALTTRINDYDFYIEDQWRVTDKLTATLGLRYEYEHLPPPPVCNSAYAATCQPINSSPKDLMPRIGLAYRLNDKTVIRAGYGIYYARVAAATLQDLFTSGNGITVSSISLSSTNMAQQAAGPVYPNILSAPPGTGLSTLSLQITSPNFSTPYSEQGSLAVERDAGHDISVTASYIWSRGIHLYSVQDLNMPTATTPFTYTIEDANSNVVGSYTTPVLLGAPNGSGTPTSGLRPNPAFGAIDEDGNGVVSFYDAFTLSVKKRFSHGFMADLSYTWSHEIDDGQGYGQSTNNLYLSNNFGWLENGNYRADMGNGLEDQPQRFVLSWVWTPTFTHRSGAFYRYAVNNWQLGSITTINTARPYGNATISVSGSATPVAGEFNHFSVNGTDLSTRVPFWPVNSVWQPAFEREDIRLTKIIPITERYKLAFNLEVFNIANNWSPSSVTTGTAYTQSGASNVIKLSSNPGFGVGSGDSYPIDGTEARRLQVSARFNF